MHAGEPNLLKLTASLVIDYFRWTQLTAMVTIWFFGLAMLATMLFVKHQEAGWDLLESLFNWIAGLPVLGNAFVSRMESLAGEDGTIKLGGNELKAVVLKAWGILSLAFWVLALISGWLFGPFKPWSLRRKLGVAAIGCVAMLAGLVAVYFADPTMFNGPRWQWILMFSGLAVLLFAVSAWCLSLAHVLGLGRRFVEASSLGEAGNEPAGRI